MKPIEFTVPWQVKPKQSTRFGNGRSFPDAKVTKNARGLACMIAEHVPDKPIEGAVSLSLVFTYPWRKSEPKANRQFETIPKDTRPDLDNLEKQVCDVLQSSGFVLDDSQIAEKHSRKAYGNRPELSVRIAVLSRAWGSRT